MHDAQLGMPLAQAQARATTCARCTTRPSRWRWSHNREALELTFKMINAETQLMYSSDYPHWDMDLPSAIYDLPFLTETAKRNILGGNAARLFGLDTKPVKKSL